MNSKIDLNTIIGFLLIGGILLYYGYTNKPEVEPAEAATEIVDSVEVKNESPIIEEKQDSLTAQNLDSTGEYAEFGPFSQAMQLGENEELFILENGVIELQISSKGGQIVAARLKDYQTWDSLPLYLINQNSVINLNLRADKTYNTVDLSFVGAKKSEDALELTLRDNNGGVLNYSYSLEPSSYMLQWDVTSKGFEKYLDRESALTWELAALRHEKNVKNERQYTALEYKHSDDDIDDLSVARLDEEEETQVKWVAYKQQFFSSILLNRQGEFEQAGFISEPLEEEQNTKVFASKLSLNTVSGDLNMPLGMYFGPNKYETLKEFDQGFEKLIPLGWGILGWINRGIVINIFNWLESSGVGYGLIILIIALIFKLILFPLTYTSYRSMAKMRVLKPQIDEMNEKNKDKDPMKKQQATMELYQKAGVNPLGGCIPMLFQFPILIALFRFFPASIELRQQPFLWATDLSSYDSIYDLPFNIPFYGDHVSLFTLLMTVSTLIYTYMNQQLTGQNQQYPQLKYMMYLMPIIFLGVFNSYAAGLSYYYFVANMITFGQQFAIRSFIDEDKILAKIEEKKKNPGKENRLMRRMKEVQEQQEQMSRSARRKKK